MTKRKESKESSHDLAWYFKVEMAQLLDAYLVRGLTISQIKRALEDMRIGVNND